MELPQVPLPSSREKLKKVQNNRNKICRIQDK